MAKLLCQHACYVPMVRIAQKEAVAQTHLVQQDITVRQELPSIQTFHVLQDRLAAKQGLQIHRNVKIAHVDIFVAKAPSNLWLARRVPSIQSRVLIQCTTVNHACLVGLAL
jgi:hypothetical protein